MKAKILIWIKLRHEVELNKLDFMLYIFKKWQIAKRKAITHSCRLKTQWNLRWEITFLEKS
ncbi:hypothetical protein EAF07_10110 [Streptococcus hillyeri]|uniref:Uncharacterized protein n=1 Tax=Streptococcus hillyeri TaxID=2282420 RepID=A0A3L9DM71_9STRE|nr:hypothetical protein EAF07_10110 [Streptococcus hillyeri]